MGKFFFGGRGWGCYFANKSKTKGVKSMATGEIKFVCRDLSLLPSTEVDFNSFVMNTVIPALRLELVKMKNVEILEVRDANIELAERGCGFEIVIRN